MARCGPFRAALTWSRPHSASVRRCGSSAVWWPNAAFGSTRLASMSASIPTILLSTSGPAGSSRSVQSCTIGREYRRMPKRRFGRVRKLPSGHWQARYRGPDSIDRPAPHTFPTKTDAERWLVNVEADVVKGTWRDPDLGRLPLGDYLVEWIAHRPNLRPRTLDLYRWLYGKYIEPTLSGHLLTDISPVTVRAWRAELIAAGASPSMVAKAYRLLRAVLNTAVDDELIRRNPCRIKGAGQERTPERPVATVDQVLELADRVPPRFRALILLAAFTSLRYGELAGVASCRHRFGPWRRHGAGHSGRAAERPGRLRAAQE